jgi:glycosyltransferase involved in cell wall biosynthesis
LNARIAIIDPGSFVLPYDYQLVKALADRGDAVDFFGSRTGYNGGFLDAMRQLPGVTVHAAAISGTVAPRWKGALAYLGLLARLLLSGPRFALINLQFSGWWPAELAVFFLLRRKFVFTVHNAVPHGFSGLQHAPTRRLATLAHSLVFVSEATREDFLRRYGEGFRARSTLLPIGLLPIAPQLPPVPYALPRPPRSLIFWSTVKPYKGVELFADLARSEAIRRRGLSLEVCGAWAHELHPLREELRGLGVQVTDRFLDDAQLLQLLSRDAVFLLPYQEASQSGALYSLLNHGCLFICSDAGDLGAFMRRFGLQGLLLKDRSPQAVLDCLDHLASHGDAVRAALQEAQRQLGWGRLLAEAAGAYGTR